MTVYLTEIHLKPGKYSCICSTYIFVRFYSCLKIITKQMFSCVKMCPDFGLHHQLVRRCTSWILCLFFLQLPFPRVSLRNWGYKSVSFWLEGNYRTCKIKHYLSVFCCDFTKFNSYMLLWESANAGTLELKWKKYRVNTPPENNCQNAVGSRID